MGKKSNEEEITKNKITVSEPKASSQHQIAIYEAGKLMLLESISISREFCKYMITASMSAIPLYLGLLKYITPDKNMLESCNLTMLFMITPCLLLLASAIIFIIGLFPSTAFFSLDNYRETEQARTQMISRRMNFVKWGTFVFLVSMILCCIVSIAFMI